MSSNGSHWYDGRFFDTFIAPNQDKIFAHIRKIVTENSSVLDVGCGTGRMAFQLADKCSRVEGVDSSRKNIDIALRKLNANPDSRLSFHHADAMDYLSRNGSHFDFAALSFIIHEMHEGSRVELLQAAAAVADRIIVVDYMVPRPGGLRTIFDELIEFVAGRENYSAFRSFVDGGGLASLIERAGLQIGREIKSAGLSAHIVVAPGKPVR